jgi:glycosyltransferase involved in cell wall biosynthesis
MEDDKQHRILVPRDRDPLSISLVIPCYNEEEVFPELRRRLEALIKQYSMPFEIVLVDDGSKDSTWPLMSKFASECLSVKAVRLARNFGHQTAITCGLDQTRGEIVVILDADLQDPPELIPAMIEKWRHGYDVVYGQRESRSGESMSKLIFAFAFYRVFEKIAKLHVPRDTGDFRLMDRRAVDALQSLKERHRFVRGMVSWIGYHQTALPYARPERFAGTTKYPFRKSLFLAIDAITSFTYAPLRLASYLGLMTSACAFFYIGVVIALKILGVNFSGYTSIMASILLLGGVQLTFLGILGEYVGRIFEQGQHRPIYLIDRIHGEPLSTGSVTEESQRI